jgi:hypothetical protein
MFSALCKQCCFTNENTYNVFFYYPLRGIFGVTNGHLQVVVTDFEERECPIGHDGQERSRDNAHHCTRNAIC